MRSGGGEKCPDTQLKRNNNHNPQRNESIVKWDNGMSDSTQWRVTHSLSWRCTWGAGGGSERDGSGRGVWWTTVVRWSAQGQSLPATRVLIMISWAKRVNEECYYSLRQNRRQDDTACLCACTSRCARACVFGICSK